MLAPQRAAWDFSRTLPTATMEMAASTPMMAITVRSSTRVNARRPARGQRRSARCMTKKGLRDDGSGGGAETATTRGQRNQTGDGRQQDRRRGGLGDGGGVGEIDVGESDLVGVEAAAGHEAHAVKVVGQRRGVGIGAGDGVVGPAGADDGPGNAEAVR